MKKLIIALLLLVGSYANAQMALSNDVKKGTVSGTVVDSSTKEPLLYVTVMVKDSKGEMVSGVVTNDDGEFTISKIPEGINKIEVQYMGYITYTDNFEITKENYKVLLESISLQEDASQLEEVVVRSETSTIEQKIDRKVIHVGKDLTSAGATAAELLNNIQSVSVDSQTGTISLRGNENVRILIDGKPSSLSAAQVLQQIPSTSIKSIELITNPSAKYNPEGMSGMINIILNKNANIGFNGNVNLGFTQSTNSRKNASIDLNYKTGKVNVFMNYGFNDATRSNKGFVKRMDVDELKDYTLQKFDMLNDRSSHLLKIGADIYINDKNTLSFYTTQNIGEGLSNAGTKVSDFNYASSVSQLSNNSNNNTNSDSKNQTYNINYKIDFEDKGHNIEFEVTYNTSESPEKSIYTETEDILDGMYNYEEDVTGDRNYTLMNIDYTKPFSDNSKLELGLEYRDDYSKNRNVTSQLNENDSRVGDSGFDYERKIYSGYINLNQKLNDVLSMQIGARFEQYTVDGTFMKEDVLPESIEQEIFTVYPSAFFTFNPSEKNQFQVSYSYRVDRPSVGQVNPIRQWSTPLTTSVGNPGLKPQFTSSYEFNYTRSLDKGSASVGVFYRNVGDNISRTLNIDPEDADKILLSYSNVKSNDRYGLELSVNYKMTNWWRANLSGDVYYQMESGTSNEKSIEVSNTTLNARLSNSFTVSKNLRLQLFGMYRGGGKSLQFEREAMWMVNTGASYTVLKGKGTVSLRANDLFKGMKFQFKSENPYIQNGKFEWESQSVYLGFAYRFGSGKNKAKRRRQRDARETQGSGGF